MSAARLIAALAAIALAPRLLAGEWPPTGYSYPSRHTAWAALGFTAAADLLAAGGARPAAVHSVRVLPTLAVGATRVLLAVHWPSDVLAGAAFAWAWRAGGPTGAAAGERRGSGTRRGGAK